MLLLFWLRMQPARGSGPQLGRALRRSSRGASSCFASTAYAAIPAIPAVPATLVELLRLWLHLAEWYLRRLRPTLPGRDL